MFQTSNTWDILSPSLLLFLMQTANSLEKTLMLGKIEGKRRRGECLSPRVRLECNPEIPVAPGEEQWLLTQA